MVFGCAGANNELPRDDFGIRLGRWIPRDDLGWLEMKFRVDEGWREQNKHLGGDVSMMG